MNPQDFARKYFDTLTGGKPRDSSSNPQCTSLHTLDNQDMVNKVSAVSLSVGALSALPSVSSWIEVTQGVYIGEVAQVMKVEKEIGMVHARVVPWSLRSILSKAQLDCINHRQPVEKRPSFRISKDVVRKWLRDPIVVTPSTTIELGTIAVHHQNIKGISPQSVRHHKEKTEKLIRALTVGMLVRLSNQADQDDKHLKTKYIVLRFVQGGYVLLCKKKLLKDSKHGDAMLVKSILLDKDMLEDETTFLPDFEHEEVPSAENSTTADSETSSFVLVHFSDLVPTIAKPGERVLICEGGLSQESKKAIVTSLGSNIDRSGDSFCVCAEITSKDKEAETAQVRLLRSQVNSLHETPITLRFREVCSFITL